MPQHSIVLWVIGGKKLRGEDDSGNTCLTSEFQFPSAEEVCHIGSDRFHRNQRQQTDAVKTGAYPGEKAEVVKTVSGAWEGLDEWLA